MDGPVTVLFQSMLSGWALSAQTPAFHTGWLGVDLIDMIRRSDAVGYLCLLTTFIFSVVSWAIIIFKYLHIQQATRQTDRFVQRCMTGSGSLEEAYKHANEYPDSPLAQILREAYLELEMENWYRDMGDLPPERQIELAKVNVERVLERTITTESSHLEGYLVFLAVTANVAPFIGLFGTVWGVTAAFQGLALMGSAELTALAPGIATALITTIAGLTAAIPASVMYNYLTNKVQILTNRMDSFSMELANIIQKALIQMGARV